jgi:hypothetical protein
MGSEPSLTCLPVIVWRFALRTCQALVTTLQIFVLTAYAPASENTGGLYFQAITAVSRRGSCRTPCFFMSSPKTGQFQQPIHSKARILQPEMHLNSFNSLN